VLKGAAVDQSVEGHSYGLDDRGSITGRGRCVIFFPSPPCSNRLWGPTSLLSEVLGTLSLGVKRPRREADL